MSVEYGTYQVNWKSHDGKESGSFRVNIVAGEMNPNFYDIHLIDYSNVNLPGESHASFEYGGVSTWSELIRMQNRQGIWYFIFPTNLPGNGTWSFTGSPASGTFQVVKA